MCAYVDVSARLGQPKSEHLGSRVSASSCCCIPQKQGDLHPLTVTQFKRKTDAWTEFFLDVLAELSALDSLFLAYSKACRFV